MPSRAIALAGSGFGSGALGTAILRRLLAGNPFDSCQEVLASAIDSAPPCACPALDPSFLGQLWLLVPSDCEHWWFFFWGIVIGFSIHPALDLAFVCRLRWARKVAQWVRAGQNPLQHRYSLPFPS